MSSDGIPGPDSEVALRVKAMESLLLEKAWSKAAPSMR